MNREKLNIAIIGCGSITRQRHAPEAAKNPRVVIKGFFDRTPERAQELVNQYGGQAYHSVDSIFKNQDVDAVIICTSNDTHASLTIKALQNHKDVMSEKPMGTNLEECLAMVQAAKDNHQRLLIDQNQRLAPAHKLAKRLIAQGVIGKPLTFKTTFGHGGPETWSVTKGSKTWFFDSQRTKHGAVFDLGIHKIDIIRYILNDDVKEVFGSLVTLDKKNSEGRPISVDDNAMAIFKTTKGVMGFLAASWTYYGEEDNATIIYGSKGIMKIFDDPKYAVKVILKDGEKINYEVGQIQTNDNQTDSGVIEEFVTALLDGQPSSIDAADVVKSMRTVFALIESNSKKKPVKVKGDD